MWPTVLVENACKGIGKLGDLVLAKWSRGKERRDALMQAQTRKEVQAIEAGDMVFTGEELISVLALPDMPPAAVPLMAGMKEEVHNLNANLAIAADILKDTPDDQVSDEPVNPDWFARWRREARVIGDEEMRVLWGRILAEEVKQPHTISLRTLDILKNITSDDARLFCKVVRFRIATLIPIEPSPLGDYELANILTLEDLNLMRFDLSLTTGVARTSEDDGYLIPCNGFVFFISGDSEPEIKRLSGAILTGAAEEIIKIADTIPPATDEEVKTIGDAIWLNISSQIWWHIQL